MLGIENPFCKQSARIQLYSFITHRALRRATECASISYRLICSDLNLLSNQVSPYCNVNFMIDT